jgi:hypothetical protein
MNPQNDNIIYDSKQHGNRPSLLGNGRDVLTGWSSRVRTKREDKGCMRSFMVNHGVRPTPVLLAKDTLTPGTEEQRCVGITTACSWS